LSLGDRKDDKKYYKDDQSWDFAEEVLRQVLKDRQSIYFESENEAAFYGPKIDVQIKNVHGKEETAFTVQYDFVMPKRFKLKYVDQNGQEQEPIVIHRSSIGAIERTMGFLIEKFGGAFPLWLAPVQVAIVPISQDQAKYAQQVAAQLRAAHLRVDVMLDAESMQNKIRKAEGEKVPYILVMGKQEVTNETVNVRRRGKKNDGEWTVANFIAKAQKEVAEKARW
jgi:threonyl-tRNA synthetase